MFDVLENKTKILRRKWFLQSNKCTLLKNWHFIKIFRLYKCCQCWIWMCLWMFKMTLCTKLWICIPAVIYKAVHWYRICNACVGSLYRQRYIYACLTRVLRVLKCTVAWWHTNQNTTAFVSHWNQRGSKASRVFSLVKCHCTPYPLFKQWIYSLEGRVCSLSTLSLSFSFFK